MSLKATEVFTPGSFPAHTYVERSGVLLEQTLRDAIDISGQIVSLVGPSKSGKTVLVEKVVGHDRLITITGAGIQSADEIWSRVLDWMEAPTTYGRSSTITGKAGGELGTTSSVSIPGIIKFAGEAKGKLEIAYERDKSTAFERTGLSQVVKEIAGSDFLILLDDFHYMPRSVQVEAAKSLKEAVRLDIKICTASVIHRGDDLIRANPELRGRVRAIDLKYWNNSDLRKIALAGFSKLRLSVDDASIDRLVLEAAGSPQLMQLLCLNTCFVLNVRNKLGSELKVTITPEKIKAILEQVSATTDFRSLVDVLDAGPRTRGVERKLYEFIDGSKGDVYRAVLKAVASDPPILSFGYDELTKRIEELCNVDPPVGSSVVGTCLHLSKLALDKFPNERAIDWDEQKQILDIPDPYLMFYLRWSGRLSEGE